MTLTVTYLADKDEFLGEASDKGTNVWDESLLQHRETSHDGCRTNTQHGQNKLCMIAVGEIHNMVRTNFA